MSVISLSLSLAPSARRWYTQQNPPRARTYSWSRHPRPALGPQQRPGSAPLYGRFCYGVHTLPVLRDYPLGPLEAGLQLGRVTPGLAMGHGADRLLVPGQSTFEPLLRSPEMSLGGFEVEHMLAKSAAADGNESGGANAAGAKGKEEQAKVRKRCGPKQFQLTVCLVFLFVFCL